MRTIYAKHEPYTDGNLAKVVAEMKQLGAPTLRVMDHGGKLCATEGSHRIAAANHLGMVPKLVIEVPDVDDGLSSHWFGVAVGLPAYDFDAVMVLNLGDFT
jgi:hypothetical protein